jgi:hypothetical protein
MIIAEASINWDQIGILAGITCAGVAVATYFSRSRVIVSPDPLRVKAAEQFAHRHELERIERDVLSLAAERKKDVGDLHEKINGVDRKVAGLEKSNELQNQKLTSMDSKLDRLIERKTP